MRTVVIYYLQDPIDGMVRYIGLTRNFGKRIWTHLNESRHTYVSRWIGGLTHRGLEPNFGVIEMVQEGKEADKAERDWIKRYRRMGHRLTNLTDGGEAAYKVSDSGKRKISHAMKKHWINSSQREHHLKQLSPLSQDEVKVIRHLIDDGIPIQQIAEGFEVSDGTISNIKVGRRWSHVV